MFSKIRVNTGPSTLVDRVSLDQEAVSHIIDTSCSFVAHSELGLVASVSV